MRRAAVGVSALIAIAVGSGALLAQTPAAAQTTLSVVGYSTLKSVYGKLIPAFEKTKAGHGITFTQSYGASGSQASAVVAGLPADVVNLSLAPDVQKLVKAGLVSPSWDTGKYQGIITNSLVVFVVRKGNPKHITSSWNSLVQPGVGVLIPNPFESGSARWNDMAAYGAELKQGKTPTQAIGFLTTLYKHVVSQDASSADALETFLAGKGDVLVTYENEAIAAEKAGDPVQYIIPQQTILIQAPIAVLSNSKNKAAANAFVNFLYSTEGQTIFAENGYRPVVKSVFAKFTKEFPTPQNLFNIQYVGGWTKVMNQFFNPTTGIMAKIEQTVGGATS
jgi:sulfate/thiosulfate transport system substrate-binding protein